VRILLADDQVQVRSALRLLLEQYPDLSVIGEAGEATGLISQVQMGCTDLVLLDWELPGLPMGDLLARLRQLCPDLMVIALSGRGEAHRSALAVGADAFVSKGEPPEQLLSAVHSFLHKTD